MKRLNIQKFQRGMREHGAEAHLMLREEMDADGVMEIVLPFIPPVYLLSKPEDAHELMVKHGDEAEKVELVQRVARSTFGNGILFSNGAVWKRQRKRMQPVFHHAHVRGYAERMMKITEAHLATWKPGSELDLAKELHQLTLKIAVDILFSTDASGTMETISEAIHDIGEGFSAQAASVFLALMPDWFPHPALQQKSRGAENFNRVLFQLIEERRKLGEEKSPQDLLSSLMFSKDPDTGETMDDEQLRSELLTLYVAGHDTTAWLLSWALAFLGENREAEARLRRELASLNGKPPTVEDFPNLPFSKMVIQETLRMRPPVWFLQRQSRVPLTLNGKSFPKNSIFTVLSYAIQHDPAIYPEPKRFKPERWADDAEKRLPKGAYIPFATGSRICIGNGFALMEAQLLLNRIVQCFKLELLDKPEIAKGTPIILGFAKPVRVKIEAIN